MSPAPTISSPWARDEAARYGIVREGVEGEHRAAAQDHLGDSVLPDLVQARGRILRVRLVGVDRALDGLRLDFYGSAAEPQRAAPAGCERRAPEPEQPGAEHVRFDRRPVLVAQGLAALDENRLVEREPDRLAGCGFRERRRHVPRLDAGNARGLV